MKQETLTVRLGIPTVYGREDVKLTPSLVLLVWFQRMLFSFVFGGIIGSAFLVVNLLPNFSGI
jgi:hypothetical protein